MRSFIAFVSPCRCSRSDHDSSPVGYVPAAVKDDRPRVTGKAAPQVCAQLSLVFVGVGFRDAGKNVTMADTSIQYWHVKDILHG